MSKVKAGLFRKISERQDALMSGHPDIKSRKQSLVLLCFSHQCPFQSKRERYACLPTLFCFSSYMYVVQLFFFLHLSRNGLTLIHSHFFSFEWCCFHAWTLGSKYKRPQRRRSGTFMCVHTVLSITLISRVLWR